MDRVECYVDDKELNCDRLVGKVHMKKPSLGGHRLFIKAIDVEGLEGYAHADWQVVDRFLRKQQNHSVSFEDKKADILFVIDDSQSMAQEQDKVAGRINKMIEALTELDWRMAMMTTDPVGSNDWEDGRILAYPNGSHWITGALGVAEAKRQFSIAVTREIQGSPNERAIHNVYRSLERYNSPVEANDFQLRNFFRAEASLSVIVVSDENESTIKNNTWDTPLPNLEKVCTKFNR